MKVPAWLLALLVLVGACVIGVYVIKGARSGIPEPFYGAAETAARAACETSYKKCLDPVSKGGEGDSVANCTTKYNTCIAASGTEIDPTTGTAVQSQTDRNLQRALRACETDKAACLLSPTPRDCTKEYQECEGRARGAGDAGSTNRAEVELLRQAAQRGDTKYLTPEMQKFLKTVQAGISSDYPDPDQASLDMAGGAGLLKPEPEYSGASPSQNKINPNQLPPEVVKLLVAKLAADKGTAAEKIQAGATVTPSVRQQIRQDVQDAVEDELQNIRNEYEVKYVTE